MRSTFVILAAGLGRRFGGLKQLQPVGPGGATLIDYAVYDAVRAGFGRVVFVISPAMESASADTLGRRFAGRVQVDYVTQRLDHVPDGCDVPDGRVKPWGTGHAVLCVERAIHEPFAIANADDFYGAASIAALGTFLQEQQDGEVPTYALVGYVLRDTLAESGTVSRAVCDCTPGGRLRSITEVTGIEPSETDARYVDQHGAARMIDGRTLVSMNLWGFTPAIFDQLRSGFREFLRMHAGSADAEFYLPAVIHDAIASGRARVEVIPSADRWCGMTHADDRERVQRFVRQLIDKGVYPQNLWSQRCRPS